MRRQGWRGSHDDEGAKVSQRFRRIRRKLCRKWANRYERRRAHRHRKAARACCPPTQRAFIPHPPIATKTILHPAVSRICSTIKRSTIFLRSKIYRALTQKNTVRKLCAQLLKNVRRRFRVRAQKVLRKDCLQRGSRRAGYRHTRDELLCAYRKLLWVFCS